MPNTIHKDTLRFLQDLGKNNNRDWFNANKEKYAAANANFIEFVDGLIEDIAKFDKTVAGLNPKDCVFRIYRDTRFSKDKSPYKTHFGAVLMGKGKSCGIAGYYLHLEPDHAFLAGGMHMAEPKILKAVREQISGKGKKFLQIIGDPVFKKHFSLEGEKLARVPQGFDKADPMGEYLKYKELVIRHPVDAKKILAAGFSDYCVSIFKSMVPFNRFVNEPVLKSA